MSKRKNPSRKTGTKEEEEPPPDSTQCPYERVISCRPSNDGAAEYLVKLKGQPYKRAEWLQSDDLQMYPQINAMLTRFSRSGSGPTNKQPYYDPAYDIVDRIITKKRNKFLVKWMKLNHDQLTWETSVDDAALEEFEIRQSAVFAKKHDNVKDFPYYEGCYFKEYIVGPNTLNQTQLAALNILFRDVQDGIHTELIDQYQSELYLSCCAFLHALFLYNDPGPYLVITQSANKWYEALRTLANATTLFYGGSKEARQEIAEYDFCIKGELRFHFMVTSSEILQHDFDIIKDINWRIVVADDAQKLKNPANKIGKYVQQLDYGHIVSISQAPANIFAIYKIAETMELTKTFNIFPQETLDKAAELRNRIQPKLLKRSAKQSNPIPSNYHFYYVDCPLCSVQKRVLKEMITKSHKSIRNQNLLPLYRRIQRIVTHPFLIFHEEYKLEDIDYMEASTKMRVFNILLDEAIANNRKVLVVSYFSRLLDIVEDLASTKDVTTERIVNRSSESEKQDALIFLYNPKYCELSNTFTDFVDTIIVFDIRPIAIMSQLRLSKTTKVSRIYYLYCRDCSEFLFFDPRNTDEEPEKIDQICKLTALSAFSERIVPNPQALVNQASTTQNKTNPNSILLEELGSDDFWNHIIPPEDENDDGDENLMVMPPRNDIVTDIDHVWTVQERDRFLRGISRFGFGRWADLCFATGLHFEDQVLISAARALAKDLVRSTSSTSSHFRTREFIRESTPPEAEEETEERDRLFFENTVFGDPNFKSNIHKNAPTILKKCETLLFINEIFNNDINQIPIAKTMGTIPSEWWTDTFDRLLIYGTHKYGFNSYDDYFEDSNPALQDIFGIEIDYIEERLLNERILRLIESVKRNTKSSDDKERKSDSRTKKYKSDNAGYKSHWTSREKSQILQYLLKNGIDCDEEGEFDYELLAANTGLQKTKSNDLIKEYVDELMNASEEKSEEGNFKPQTSHRIRLRVNCLSQLRHIIKPKLTDEEGIQVFESLPKWKTTPACWTHEIEYYFFKEIRDNGFGNYEEIFKQERFAEAFEGTPIPNFFLKEPPIMRRIKSLYKHAIEEKKPEKKELPKGIKEVKKLPTEFKEPKEPPKIIIKDINKLALIPKDPPRLVNEVIMDIKDSIEIPEPFKEPPPVTIIHHVPIKKEAKKPIVTRHAVVIPHTQILNPSMEIKRLRRSDVPQYSYEQLASGNFKFPLILTKSTRLYNLGTVVYDRPGFHNNRYIFPAGFRSGKIFASYHDPTKLATYINEIIDTGKDSPLFRVYMEDYPEKVFEGSTMTAPWRLLRNAIKGNVKEDNSSVKGSDYFCLSQPVSIFLIENMPNVDKCVNYIKRNIKLPHNP